MTRHLEMRLCNCSPTNPAHAAWVNSPASEPSPDLISAEWPPNTTIIFGSSSAKEWDHPPLTPFGRECIMSLELQNEPRAKIEYPKLGNTRYKSLDMWRGIACLMIVLLHGVFFAKPNLTATSIQQHHLAAKVYSLIQLFEAGVPMFFVISGYC